MPRKARISDALVGLMKGGERHAWTLDELHAELVRRGPAGDFSSVFRAAEKLAGDGTIRKILFEDGRARFELVGAHHDHLHCVRCARIVPVPCVIGQRDILALERKTGVAITEHHLVLNGLCRECRVLGTAAEARR